MNRALALQNLYLYEEATADWNAYLEIDSESGWADEARDHLRRLAEKKR